MNKIDKKTSFPSQLVKQILMDFVYVFIVWIHGVSDIHWVRFKMIDIRRMIERCLQTDTGNLGNHTQLVQRKDLDHQQYQKKETSFRLSLDLERNWT